MFRLFMILSIYLSLAYAVKPKPSQEAAILSESRYLNTAGQFGSSYIQEDGVEFTEESDSEGNRKGSYTYIDPNGQKKTVTYTAGKDGFNAVGDHLPVAPAPVNPFSLHGLPQLVPINYQVQQVSPALIRPSGNTLQLQFQSLPINGNSLLNLFQFQPQPEVSPSSTETSLGSSRHYPPAKLNVKHSSDGFSYTFNSIV